ncbi:winged helix family two component transcriptional regulator [Paenibacillus cellulosilyticus]|uniref:Winged helix family two component transcriptional regulator n=1 Tax=Paenibacillus cellulosilyticus TaxID=375489 RepID=A0A2V2YXA5_9BACL|nr:response regulator transcription factor [Paenibacillus cellulosilyticus]PWW02790.1 winged helix family two component transcriptional regulator [Paenibacillus cellulosilyticus]QKS45713.1 response regulator transcription factor [Paenibacillus cellulosilyticus]
MSKRIHILICDDNQAVHDTIGTYLKADGMTYCSAYTGKEALLLAREEHPDLIVLDIMMPELFGTDVCKEIRKESQVPIILLTAKGEEHDRIDGLEIGADDYIVKPFSPREVVVRIKTILRRAAPQEVTMSPQLVYEIDQLRINRDGYELSVDGQVVPATPKEIEILYLLATNAGRVLSREHILTSIWGFDYLGDTRAVDTHIKRLRSKLPIDPVGWSLKSIYGVGYKFEVHE